MERPKPKPLSELDFKEMYDEVIKLTEEKLDWLDEGWEETGNEEYNSNEDILDDNDEGILEAVIKAIYGDKFWDYFNSKT